MENLFKKLLLFLSFSLLLTPAVPGASSQIQNDFKPSWWLPDGHSQTIYGGLFRPDFEIPYERERINLPDGDFLDLDWVRGEEDKPLVFILHGLSSSSKSLYVKALVRQFQTRGWTAVVMNFRGHSGEPNRTNATTHAGRSDDLDAAVKHVLQKSKSERVYLAGFSLGANILLKWLGENSGFIPSRIQKAAAVSGPYNLEKTSRHLDRNWFNRNVYVRGMLNSLIPLALAQGKRYPGSLNEGLIAKAKTFEIYDREVTAKLNGFKDEKDYWHKSSAMNYMPAIQTPVLVIHAADDPFLPAADLPYNQMLQSSSIQLLLTEGGGHLGFVSGEWPWKQNPWLEKTIADYFEKEAEE